MLTNYIRRLEHDEDKLREELDYPSCLLDGNVLWAFPFGINLDDKKELKKFLAFIIDVKVNPLAGIGDLLKLANMNMEDIMKEVEEDYLDEPEENRSRVIALGKALMEGRKKEADDWLAGCLKKTTLSREEFYEKYESEYTLDYSVYEHLIHREERTLTDLTKKFEDFCREFHLLASGFHKPHVLTEDYDKYNEKMEQMIEDFKAKQEDCPVASQVPDQREETKGV